ncbi:MAG: hypothetical protein U9P72_00415 [Campylobacterota bacterium]|nr:hypothetical protein [Campylobacterota bacterium]
MKKITLSLLVASMSLLAYEGHSENTDSQVYVQSQTVVNNIVADAPKTNFITSGKEFGAAAQYVNAGDVTILNIPLGMQVGFGFGVEVNIPLVSVKNFGWAQDKNTGIGDISVGGNYNFGSVLESTGLNITTVLYKTATGDVDKGLGSDVDAISLTHKFSKSLNTKYTVNALLSYTLNDDTVSGDSYMLMGGASMPCLLSNKVTTSAKLTYFSVAENKYNFGELTSADLWLQWDSDKLVNNLPLGFGVKLPLINEVDGNDKDKTVVFYLSMASFF